MGKDIGEEGTSRTAEEADVDRLLAELERSRPSEVHLALKASALMAVLLLCVVIPLSALLIWVAETVWGPSRGGVLSGAAGAPAGVAGLFCMGYYRTLPARKLASRLARCDDMRVVGPLLEAHVSSFRRNPAIEAALLRLLPRMGPAGGAFLSEAERRHLRIVATSPTNVSLTLAALGAMEAIGGKRELAALNEALGTIRRKRQDPRITEAARRCSRTIADRLAHEKAMAPLVRAVAAPDQAATTLARPAAGAQQSEQLVRPTVAEE